MSELDDLYHAVIVAHDRAPDNHGPLPGATAHGAADNPLCGDEVTVHLALAGETIAAATFEARGCALCRAAGSILTTMLAGRTVADARALTATFEAMVRAAPDAPIADSLGELGAFAGVRRFRSRQPCALLPFRALAVATMGG